MRKKIDRVLVAIFDIENFSIQTPKQQLSLVRSFIKDLSDSLSDIEKLQPDAFSTGDGAIISIGRKCSIEERQTKAFLNLIIELVVKMRKSNITLRASVNYSELDRALITSDYDFIQGNFIQIGDTINVASRILNYCEPGEIIINESVYNLLRKLDLHKDILLHKNELLITKHGLQLDTFTYIPSADVKGYLYCPDNEKQRYKKFNYFPPVKGDTIKFYREIGLQNELLKVAENAFETVKQINFTNNLASTSNVFNVLTNLQYDETDTVYVLSREDRENNFWTQPRRENYIKFLKANAKKSKSGFINQTRVRVWGYGQDREILDGPGVKDELIGLHKPNSYFSITDESLNKFRNLSKFIFGFTLSKKNKYAIIPIPDPQSCDGIIPECEHIGTTLVSYYSKYNAKDGPMKAIIATDSKFIESLISDFERLSGFINKNLGDVHTLLLK